MRWFRPRSELRILTREELRELMREVQGLRAISTPALR